MHENDKGSNESIDRFDRIKVSFCMSINANKKSNDQNGKIAYYKYN